MAVSMVVVLIVIMVAIGGMRILIITIGYEPSAAHCKTAVWIVDHKLGLGGEVCSWYQHLEHIDSRLESPNGGSNALLRRSEGDDVGHSFRSQFEKHLHIVKGQDISPIVPQGGDEAGACK